MATEAGGAASRAAVRDAIVRARVVARLSRWVESAVGDTGLSLPQYRVLAFLADGSSAAKSLARNLDVSPPSITTLVDGLVERGLVERHRSEDDRRRVDHRLTRSGRRALTAADAAVDEQLEDLTSYLDGSEGSSALDALNLWGEALDAKRAEIAREQGA